MLPIMNTYKLVKEEIGLNQISMFEAKIANGKGEQTLSRDIYRLGHHFDFFRMIPLLDFTDF